MSDAGDFVTRELDRVHASPSLSVPDQDDDEHTGYLAIGVEPRDCRNTAGLRPCPFASCPHHLLIDYVTTERHEPSLTLSRARLPMFADPRRGRRRELAPDAPSFRADEFIEQAVARLWEMPDTCEREVSMRGGADHDGLMSIRAIAAAIGAEEDEVGMDLDDALCTLRGAALASGADPDDHESMISAMTDVLGTS